MTVSGDRIDSDPSSIIAESRSTLRRLVDRVFDVAEPSGSGLRSVAFLVWLLWMALALLLQFTHEPWRDELQAWGIVRASSTPLDLLSNLRHEGHPPSWYMLLWPVSQLERSFVGLKVVAFAVGSAATWITLRTMPISVWLRAAIVFSYFPLFEFGTISRSYSLAWLLTVVVLWLATRPGTPNWLLALTLATLAGTHVLMIPLAIAIAIGLWGGSWFTSRSRGPINVPWLAAFTAIPLLIVIVSMPAVGGGPEVNASRLSPGAVGESTATVVRALFPVMDSDTWFWGRFIVRDWTTWGPVLGLVLIAVIAWCVRRSRSALTVWLVSTTGYLIVHSLSGQPMSPRLVSPLWCGAIAATWLAAADRRALPAERRRPVPLPLAIGVTFLLGASLWASSWAVRIGVTAPFTSAAAAAEWIEEQAAGKEIVILCAINTPMCSSVSIRLDVPAYRSADGKPIYFVDWSKGWYRTLGAESIFGAANELARRTGAEVFIVAPGDGYPPGCQSGLWPSEKVVTEYVLVCSADQLWDVSKN